jgi:hypothetical protein
MKKMGMLASANGDVSSATRDPASMPALAPYTLSAAYVSLEMATFLAWSLGRRLMAGSKTDFAQAELQTMEHSMGVTLMLRKPLLWPSMVRSAPALCVGSWLGGRRTFRMGWSRLG